MNYQTAALYAGVLKAAAHPMRVRIIDELRQGDRCVRDLAALGTINQSNVSRHLATLEKAGIISGKRHLTKVIYHLESPEILDIFQPAAQVAKRDINRRKAKGRDL
ncbi:MAG: ArsR family transcriptional regulator [Verrucomicrobia bacterium]|nr:MAG: ArsR family transcriptional regulator [Verrucomicrobiota bacterium]